MNNILVTILWILGGPEEDENAFWLPWPLRYSDNDNNNNSNCTCVYCNTGDVLGDLLPCCVVVLIVGLLIGRGDDLVWREGVSSTDRTV